MKRWLLNGLLAAMLTGLIFLTCMWAPTFTYVIVYTNSGEMPVYYGMEHTNWCGVACLKMMYELEKGNAPSQEEIAYLADRNQDGLLSDYEVCAYLNNYVQWGKFADYQRSWENFLLDLKVLVNSYEPLICAVQGRAGIDHWVFIDGYRVPFSDLDAPPDGIVFADPASTCSTWYHCVGVYYDYNVSDFQGITGRGLTYIGKAMTPKISPDNKITDQDVQTLPVYVNYGTAKKAPDSGPNENIPFADGSNGIPDSMNERIMRAADSVVAVWNGEQSKNLSPAYQEQFEGAFACPPEKVNNMAKSGDIPGGDYWFVPYLHRSGSYYVGAVKIGPDGKKFIGKGIAGFILSGAATMGSPSQSSKIISVSSKILVTRQVLHQVYPDCKFFPFWGPNEITGVDFLPFWYGQRPDGTRFILDWLGREMVRDAKTGVLYLKSSNVKINQGSVTDKPSLSQNYPNPFNPETQINFTVPNFAPVKIEIFNVLGQRIKTLVDCEYQAGEYRIVWDGTNQADQKVTSGVYFYRCQIGSSSETKKMIMIK